MDKCAFGVSILGVLIVLYMFTVLLIERARRTGINGEAVEPNSSEAMTAYIEPAGGQSPKEDIMEIRKPIMLKPLPYRPIPVTPARPDFYPSTNAVDLQNSIVVTLSPNTQTRPSFLRIPFEVDSQMVRPTLDINSGLLQLPSSDCTYSCGATSAEKKASTLKYDAADIGRYACRENDDGDYAQTKKTDDAKQSSYTSFVCTALKNSSAGARIVTLGNNRTVSFAPNTYPFETVTKHWRSTCTPTPTYPATVGLGDGSLFLNAIFDHTKSQTFALLLTQEKSYLIFNPDEDHISNLSSKLSVPWTPHLKLPAARTIPLTSVLRNRISADNTYSDPPYAAGTLAAREVFDIKDEPFTLDTTSPFTVTYDQSNETLSRAFGICETDGDIVVEFVLDSANTRIRKTIDSTLVQKGDVNSLGLGFLESLITVVNDEVQTVTFASANLT